MPIKNKPGFIPRSAKYQPDFYIELFGHVCAVYTHPTTNATIYMEVDADTWNHQNYLDASGDLQIQYQSDCRRPLGRHKTLKDALQQIDKIMSNPEFGKGLNPAPTFREWQGKLWLNTNLLKKTKKLRRAGNGKPFRLTDEDKKTLISWGEQPKYFPQIEEAANKSTYILDKEYLRTAKAINVWQAIELLGRDTFLSGIHRSAFHWTSYRTTPDGKHEVSFDSSILFKKN